MKVSLIITCYNREDWIARAIRSALSQTFPSSQYEIIVVDDGSTDNSQSIIRDFGGSIQTIWHDKNYGLPTARNNGIRKAKGRHILHLDSDDYIHTDTVYILDLFLNLNSEWGAVACDYLTVDERENHLQRHDAAQEPIACGIMFRKDFIIQAGLYAPDMLLLEEREFRNRFEKKFVIGHCPLPLYRYRKHESNMTNDEQKMALYESKLKKI